MLTTPSIPQEKVGKFLMYPYMGIRYSPELAVC